MSEKNIEEKAVPVIQDTMASGQLSISQLGNHMSVLHEAMDRVLKEDTHYGVIPGTQKPTLLKAGAEALCTLFRLGPDYTFQLMDMGNGHREYIVTCKLIHIPTGNFIGSGIGSCSTHETKYRYRKAQRTCPECGSAAIIKGKAEYGGGWLCYRKKGGCGAKFNDNDPNIIDQVTDRVENPDIADTYNTVLKMGEKRALVAAILNATSASDMFTQDMEDIANNQPEPVSSALKKAKPKNEMTETQATVKKELKRLVESGLITGDDVVETIERQTGKKQRIEQLNDTQAETVLELCHAMAEMQEDVPQINFD
jgi:hypothetical protein